MSGRSLAGLPAGPQDFDLEGDALANACLPGVPLDALLHAGALPAPSCCLCSLPNLLAADASAPPTSPELVKWFTVLRVHLLARDTTALHCDAVPASEQGIIGKVW